MKSLRRIFAASLLLMPLYGSPGAARAEQATATDADLRVYYCQNLAVITVRVLPKRVEVITSNRKATLTETASPSPVQFSDGSLTLSGLGDVVRFEEPGSVYWCRHNPAEVPWQDARLRGIDFRAAGDPVWSLEVDAGVAVEFASGIGAARTVIRFPPVEPDKSNKRMAWTTKTPSHALTVVADERVCHHAGSTMTLAVTLTLDGTTYNGCGRRFATE